MEKGLPYQQMVCQLLYIIVPKTEAQEVPDADVVVQGEYIDEATVREDVEEVKVQVRQVFDV